MSRARMALRLHGVNVMKECSFRTQGEWLADELAERDTISRLIETRRAASARDESAVPVEITPETTERYPIGLGEDLCGLSACRPPPRVHGPH
jgi:hypothetical protein